MTVKLGVVGFSKGNGHPYSWSAIINGYNSRYMETCGFPSIPKYLSQQCWPEAKLKGATVTHVLTSSEELSEHIARAGCIAQVAKTPEEMIKEVDGVLIARDDAESRVAQVMPFVQAGLPIYIDKPIALSCDVLDTIYAAEQYEGQIFTCSALRYASELTLDSRDRNQLGKIKHIDAFTPKSWDKYSVHIIEPSINILGTISAFNLEGVGGIAHDGVRLGVRFATGETLSLTALGAGVNGRISIRVYGEDDWKELVFMDSFSAFHSALADFLKGIKTRSCRSSHAFNRHVVSLIEEGRKHG